MARKAKICFECNGAGVFHLEECILNRALDSTCDCAPDLKRKRWDGDPGGHICQSCNGTGRRGRHDKT